MANINFYNNVLGIEGFIFNILHLTHLAYIHRSDELPMAGNESCCYEDDDDWDDDDDDDDENELTYNDMKAFGSGDYGLIIHFSSELAPECYMHRRRKYSKLVWFDTEGKRTAAIKRIGGVLQCSSGDS